MISWVGIRVGIVVCGVGLNMFVFMFIWVGV